ncbi:Bifunctional protein GlmU [Bienertia sinuspersici]
MASVQQVQGAAQFGDKEKAAIQEAMKEAQNFVANNDNAKARQEQVVITAGVMMNAQPRSLMQTQTHDWKGHYIINPPKIIGGDTISDGFVHEDVSWSWISLGLGHA